MSVESKIDVVPVAPGKFRAVTSDGKMHDVIAWRVVSFFKAPAFVQAKSYVEPLVWWGDLRPGSYAIVCPDGSIQDAFYDEYYNCLEDAVKSLREAQARNRIDETKNVRPVDA